MRKIRYTKRGQPYIILKNGRAKFIKAKSKRRKYYNIRGVKMARRRRSKSYKSYARKSYSKHSELYNLFAGFLYGAIRTKIGGKVAETMTKIPLLNKLPVQYADNIGMSLLAWATSKGKIPLLNKVPMSRKIGKQGIGIEGALLGSEIALGGFGIPLANGNSNINVYDAY